MNSIELESLLAHVAGGAVRTETAIQLLVVTGMDRNEAERLVFRTYWTQRPVQQPREAMPNPDAA